MRESYSSLVTNVGSIKMSDAYGSWEAGKCLVVNTLCVQRYMRNRDAVKIGTKWAHIAPAPAEWPNGTTR